MSAKVSGVVAVSIALEMECILVLGVGSFLDTIEKEGKNSSWNLTRIMFMFLEN